MIQVAMNALEYTSSIFINSFLSWLDLNVLAFLHFLLFGYKINAAFMRSVGPHLAWKFHQTCQDI